MRVLIEGLKSVKDSHVRQLGVITVFVISLCFAFAMVIACSEIPDSLSDVPIPVINEDRGYDGSNYGEKIVEGLEDSDKANWVISDSSLLKDGIEKTEYNMAFVIPEDFSEKLMSAKNGDPEQADIVVHKNIRKNFVMAQLFRIIESEFTKNISASVSKEYTEAAFDSLYDVKDGMKDAVEGTDQLQEGADKLSSGASELSGGIDLLNDSVEEMEVPEIKLTKEQKQEISESAAAGTSGYGKKISKGIANNITKSIGSSINSKDAKETAVTQVKAAALSDESLDAMMAAFNQYNLFYDADPKTQAMKQATARQILVGVVSQVIEESIPGTLDGTAQQVKGSSQKIQKGIEPSVSSAISQISSGVAVNTAESVMEEVDTQTTKTMNTVKEKLSDATGKLSDGGHKLSAGTGELSAGVTELHDGLADGQKELEVNLVTPSDEMGEFVSEPLGTEEVKYGITDNYGYGLSPLFIAIGLWVGALILFILLPARPPKTLNAGRFSTVFGTWAFMSIFGVAEAILISIGIIFFGINLADPLGLFLMTAVASVCFIAVMEFLVHMLGLGGSSLCVILTAFQICCCEGTFPTNVMPGFFGVLQPFLPMNYAIDGFREVLFAGDRMTMLADMGALAIFAIVFIGLDLIFVHKTERYVDHIAAALGR